jgi:pilus assembly protein CpaE
MTIICERDPAAIAALAPVVDAGRGVRAVPDLAAAALSLQDDTSEDLVVIGQEASLGDIVQFTQHLHAERPGVAVILLRHQYEPNVVTAALSAGVREVVADNPNALHEAYERLRKAVLSVPAEQPSGPQLDTTALVQDVRLTDELLGGVVDPAAAVTTDPAVGPQMPEQFDRQSGKVITVFAPKGGTGKTTISTNLAAALYADGTRRVCLVDLDLEFGDVAISLGLTPVNTLADAVTTQVSGSISAALALLTTQYRPGLDCILAPIEPGDAEKIPTQLVSDLLNLLRETYEYVVVDTPSQLSEKVLAALDVSDHFVLLANPELPSLKNLRLTLDMLDLLGYKRDARAIVFNRADTAAGLSVTEVQDALKSEVAAEVPASRDVPWSINNGEPIVTAKPDHPVSVAIKEFANSAILGEAPRGAHKRRRPRRRLFKGRGA